MTRFLIALGCFLTIDLQAQQLPGFTITNEFDSINGATWTYKATVNSITYDLQGILFVPAGKGPFPAIIINHGTGGNVNGYSKPMAQKMVKWGFVCIATNYTHASGVPCGLPGSCVTTQYGASAANVQRGMKCWDILASRTYVNTNCIMTFGHSRGAFTTTQLVSDFPAKFSAAAHTAGGIVNSSNPLGVKIPLVSDAAKIITPYLIHHGDDDTLTVPVSYDVRLDSLLTAKGITHTLHLYDTCNNQPVCGHNEIKEDSLMLARTKAFFNLYKCENNVTTRGNENYKRYFTIYSNPVFSQLFILSTETGTNQYQLINSIGQTIIQGKVAYGQNSINMNSLQKGIYFLRIASGNTNNIFIHKIIKS